MLPFFKRNKSEPTERVEVNLHFQRSLPIFRTAADIICLAAKTKREVWVGNNSLETTTSREDYQTPFLGTLWAGEHIGMAVSRG